MVAGSPKVTLNGRSRRLQFGTYLGEDDIVRKQDDYGRVARR